MGTTFGGEEGQPVDGIGLIDIASGRAQTKNERNGFREIAIWKDGVTL